jgi:hypothetical protein
MNKCQRVDAIAVASLQVKLVGHQIYSQLNQHDFGDVFGRGSTEILY